MEIASRAGLTTGDYAMALQGDDWYLCAENEHRSNFARFVNHSVRRCNVEVDGLDLPAWVGHIARLPTSPFALFFRTTRDIRAGEELCINYGQRYWDQTTSLGSRLHHELPILSSFWRLHPRRLTIDYW